MRVRSALAVIVVAMMVGVGAPAQAAFPGRDGLLAIQPRSGGGIELIDAGTGAVRRLVCTDRALCGTPTAPRFSPDGAELAFSAAGSGRPGIIAVSGACLWCLLGAPLTASTGTGAAFIPSGAAVTIAGAGVLLRAVLGGQTTIALRRTLADPAWSVGGRLAFDSGGWIWIIAVGSTQPRRLARGSAPAWSPDGRSIAFARAGRVWIVPVGGGHPRLLARGSAPAFAPDGKRIALIGTSGRLLIARVAGGGAHPLAGVTASSVDWQPLPPRRATPCAPSKPAQVLAQDAEAVVTDVRSRQDGSTTWYGCLRALGRRFKLLGGLGEGYEVSDTVAQVRLAGRYALFQINSTDKSGGCSISVKVSDLSTGVSTEPFTADCGNPSGPLPPVTDAKSVTDVGLDSSGFSAWRLAVVPDFSGTAFTGLACPSPSLCVATDAAGDIVTSTAPAGGRPAWTVTKLPAVTAFSSVACASQSLCVALSGPSIVTTTNPTGGPSAWTSAPIPGPSVRPTAIACPSVALCVAVDGSGDVLHSTNPAGGGSTWTRVNVDGTQRLTSVACPSAALCVAVDQGTDVVTSTNPAGGAPAWKVTNIYPGPFNPAFTSVACSSPSLCVATAAVPIATVGLVVSTNPTGGASAWPVLKVPGLEGAVALACSPASLCLVADGANDVGASIAPAAGASAWAVTGPFEHMLSWKVTSMACPSSTVCVAVDNDGHVLTSTDPAGGAVTWSTATVDAPICAVYSPCISEGLFVHDEHGTHVVDAALAGAGTSIGAVRLAGNSLRLVWTHDGVEQALTLK